MNILLIEDDSADVEYISQVLVDENITVLPKPPKNIDSDFDLIITDFFYDGVNCLNFLKDLAKSNSNTPVLIISGKIDEVNLETLPKSLNALVLSKNERFKELLKYYTYLLCPKDDYLQVDYKTLFLDLVHDLKNDLVLAAYYKECKDELDEEDMEEVRERLINSSQFAYSRLEKMANFLNSQDEVYSTLKDAYAQIKDSQIILENKDSVTLGGDIDKKLSFISSFFLSVILKNLIENSCKYKDPKRELVVNVMLSETEDHHLLTVTDNALGMTKENSETLFHERKRKSKTGLGIGLVVLNRIITSLRGSVKVHSRLGEGTTVMVAFPKK